MIKNKKIKRAIEVLREMNLGRNLRYMYEAHMKKVRDRKAQDDYVRDEGIAEGFELGTAKGIELGTAKGIALGKAEVILMFLDGKGEIPAKLAAMIQEEKNPDKLNKWVKKAAEVKSVEEFENVLLHSTDSPES